ncbi:MAG: hypothetical protein HFG24_09300 [Anaerotruncus sp.]|nr:hypothetical protein [Anaerotruncus sp.]MCI9236150.1 hypothetical protein [Anaerotruncus sp.]
MDRRTDALHVRSYVPARGTSLMQAAVSYAFLTAAAQPTIPASQPDRQTAAAIANLIGSVPVVTIAAF